MSKRFEAESILRAAASGAFPAPGQVLFRIQDGWVFQAIDGSVIGPIPPSAITSLPFHKITGVATKAQLPPEIAYEDEVNIFLLTNTFQAQVRRGIRTITASDSPYTWQISDWHLNVDTTGGQVQVDVPDAVAHFSAGFTDQLHLKHIGRQKSVVRLKPVVPGQLIDGSTEAIIRSSMRSFTLVSDGGDWWIQ